MPSTPFPASGTVVEAAATRPSAVAGLFYPAAPGALRSLVEGLLANARVENVGRPRALVAPHAGYDYSGSTAAAAYARILGEAGVIRRVVLAGPTHRVAFRGIAVPTHARFATPLGEVPVDTTALGRIRELPGVQTRDDAHRDEHSLEVHLPFLQVVLGDFDLVPLVVGEAAPECVARVLEALWGGEETLIVVSTDLSHFLDYETARAVDRRTARLIESHRTDIGPEQACGCRPLNGLLRLASSLELPVRSIALESSGDTAGDRHRVVGYGAFSVG